MELQLTEQDHSLLMDFQYPQRIVNQWNSKTSTRSSTGSITFSILNGSSTNGTVIVNADTAAAEKLSVSSTDRQPMERNVWTSRGDSPINLSVSSTDRQPMEQTVVSNYK